MIWDPQNLPMNSCWYENGPDIKVEFARQSGDNRITLVLDEKAEFVQSLWCLMASSTVDVAREELRKREKTSKNNIGVWERQRSRPWPSDCIRDLPEFAKQNKLDAVVWTDLDPKIGDESRRPSMDEVIDHLRNLTGGERIKAEEYICKTHPQIKTKYRRKIEKALRLGSM